MNSFDDFTAFLQGPVGNALANDPGDVRATKQNLKRAGYFPGEDEDENDYITRALDTGIRNFQRDNSLRIDGRLFPGGETERSLFENLTGRSANSAFGRAETEHGGFAGFGGSVSGMASSGERQSPDFTPNPLFRTGGFSGRNGNGKTAQVSPASERERQAQKDNLFQVIAEKDSPAIGGFGQPAQNTDATGRTIKPKKNIHKQESEKKASTFPAPTFEPVDKNELQKILDFDPDKGGGDFHSFLKYGFEPDDIARKAEKEAQKIFPKLKGFEDDSDAFRHSLGSYMMTKRYGSQASKKILDRHERAPGQNLSPNDTEMGMLQDLYNNRVGRDAALDPENRNRDPVEVIKELYDAGKLQTRPFRLKPKKRTKSK